MKSLIIAATLWLGLSANASVEAITMAVKVKSFDQKIVNCEANGVEFKVEREFIGQEKFHEGDIVLIHVPGSKVTAMMGTAKKTK